MSIKFKRYSLFVDFERVLNFLSDNYKYPCWWLTPQFFEYAHYHPMFNPILAHRFGIWEDRGEIVGAAFYEMDLGDAVLSVKNGYDYLKREIIEYAERELSKIEDGKKMIGISALDCETENDFYFQNGYSINYTEHILIYDYSKGLPEYHLPEGFRMITLDDETDLLNIKQCLWRGFDHGDTLPDNDIDANIHAKTAPNFRTDLTTIVKAPNGEYVCFAGMWYDEKNKYAYLEPLATVPEYRRMGLAKAAFSEAMRKTRILGAAYSYCGTREFYVLIGCEKVGNVNKWKKEILI